MNGRFAPSPTGVLHLGNLRTALLAWLFARSAGGRFVVRMDDLDLGRVRERFYGEQLADLAAMGLDWDGEVVRQSARIPLYEEAIARLDVYECFCTRAETREAVAAPHGPLPQGAYPGTCRALDAPELARRRAAGRAPALRVRADAERVRFSDRLLGARDGLVDDFVVRRADGAIAYNLAVVVDDVDQRVEEVVRGADLLESTPRQLWLARRLGVPEPVYAHVPLVLGPDGARLAKRHGAVTLRDMSPRDALGWMGASLGLPGDSPQEMLESFDPERVPREPTVLG